MNNRNKNFKTSSLTSPKTNQRGCLCANNTYSRNCCDGSLQAQGIGLIYKKGVPVTYFLTLENDGYILQENGDKLLKEVQQQLT